MLCLEVSAPSLPISPAQRVLIGKRSVFGNVASGSSSDGSNEEGVWRMRYLAGEASVTCDQHIRHWRSQW
jgi:hypothetical protein